jgi:hypothetical protein
LDFSVSRIAKTSIVQTSPMSRTWKPPEEPLTPPLVGEAMTSSSSCQVHPQIISPCSPTNRELYAMVMDLKAGLNENKFELKEFKDQLKEFKDLGREWSRNDLILCAAEILKWSVKLRGENDADARQFFRDDLFPLVAVSIRFSVHARV